MSHASFLSFAPRHLISFLDLFHLPFLLRRPISFFFFMRPGISLRWSVHRSSVGFSIGMCTCYTCAKGTFFCKFSAMIGVSIGSNYDNRIFRGSFLQVSLSALPFPLLLLHHTDSTRSSLQTVFQSGHIVAQSSLFFYHAVFCHHFCLHFFFRLPPFLYPPFSHVLATL